MRSLRCPELTPLACVLGFQKNTYSADWDEIFRFDIEDVGSAIGGLELVVFDWDRMKANDVVSSRSWNEASALRMRS